MDAELSSKVDLAAFYESAKTLVIENGYQPERKWQEFIQNRAFSESDFLRETAWVILCSGFREKYVRNIFSFISLAFCDWESAGEIAQNREACKSLALAALNNKRKIDAILLISEHIANEGFDAIKARVEQNALEYLAKFPMIGHVTAKHLAKNLGFPTAKNDRHLLRLAEMHGYSCVSSYCETIAAEVGESIPLVDITLWRYAVILQEFSREHLFKI